MENKTGMVVALAIGIAIGLNWPKLKKHVMPYMTGIGAASGKSYDGIAKFIGEQKERLEDAIAELRSKKGSKAAKATRKRTRKIVTAAATAS